MSILPNIPDCFCWIEQYSRHCVKSISQYFKRQEYYKPSFYCWIIGRSLAPNVVDLNQFDLTITMIGLNLDRVHLQLGLLGAIA